jgi:hypothetical protein
VVVAEAFAPPWFDLLQLGSDPRSGRGEFA